MTGQSGVLGKLKDHSKDERTRHGRQVIKPRGEACLRYVEEGQG